MNDIDMWNDIEDLELLIKKAKTKEDKAFWQKELDELMKEFVELYIESN